VIAFSAVGKVEAADYEVLKPAIEKAVADHEKVRIVFEMGPEFEGYTAGAAWEDARLWAPHLTDWERVAVVTDHAFMAGALRAFGAIMPGEIKVFPVGELDKATEWAAS
jgi:hypothetical protein